MGKETICHWVTGWEFPDDPEKVENEVMEADDLYKEIRIEKSLRDHAGDKVKLIQERK